ncbi:MAG: hypothetical protein A2148_08785 [Chloroflexi bacterium RBG_16_68_14]|nr:MAG: hypothetical protein A2148_08785 [Chloroflexi bacterium RBG_16_68_14]
MADERLRVAVIGVGAMGANHVRVLGELPEAELVAIADTDEARLAAAPSGRSVRAYDDYRQLLAEERLDAVTVAVPTRRHLEVALACIERRVPVLVEKPLAADADECERLGAAAEAQGVPLMVGHVERFNPAVQELKRRLDDGELGRVLQLRARRVGPFYQRERDVGVVDDVSAPAPQGVPLMVGHVERFNPAVQELKRRLDDGELGRVLQLRARRVGPFYQRERDVGVVHDLATHDIDVFRCLLGCEVERVQAETLRGVRTEYEDALAGLLRFENGAVGVLEVNWLTPVKVRELTVLGERGMFVVDYLGQELRFHPSAGGASPDDARQEPEVVAFPDPGEAPLRAELASFLRVARGLEPPPVSAADALAAMRVVEALVESARRGAAVRVAAGRAVP